VVTPAPGSYGGTIQGYAPPPTYQATVPQQAGPPQSYMEVTEKEHDNQAFV